MSGYGLDLRGIDIAATELGKHKDHATATVDNIDRSHTSFLGNGAPGVAPLMKLGNVVHAPLLALEAAINEMFVALRAHQCEIVLELSLAYQTLSEIRSGHTQGDSETDIVTSFTDEEPELCRVTTAALAGWHGAAAQAFHTRVDEIQQRIRDHAGYTAWLGTHLARYAELNESARESASVIAASTAEPTTVARLATDSLRQLEALAAAAANSVTAHLKVIVAE